MTSTISSWGNSQGLRLPKNIMKELNLSIGDKVKVSVENQKIVLELTKKPKRIYNINDLVANIPHNYKAHEEFEHKAGLEEW